MPGVCSGSSSEDCSQLSSFSYLLVILLNKGKMEARLEPGVALALITVGAPTV